MAGQSGSLHLGDTLGAMLIGNIFAAVFFGITTVQTYFYYKRSANDPLVMRGLIAYLWILDILHTIMITHSVYTYAVIDFMNPDALSREIWSIPTFIVITSANDVVVRSLYLSRLWRLSNRNKPLAAAIVLTTLIVTACGWAFGIKMYLVSSYSALDGSSFSSILYCGLTSGAISDMLIASSLSVFLYRCQTGFTRTDSILRKLMAYSIENGVLTSVCALACLIAYATMPHNYIYIAMYFVLSKLFLNSLLANLNARDTLRESGNVMTIPLSDVTSSDGPRDFSVMNSHQLTKICVETTTNKHTDPSLDITQVEKGNEWHNHGS